MKKINSKNKRLIRNRNKLKQYENNKSSTNAFK